MEGLTRGKIDRKITWQLPSTITSEKYTNEHKVNATLFLDKMVPISEAFSTGKRLANIEQRREFPGWEYLLYFKLFANKNTTN